MYMLWKDRYLRWNPKDYQGVNETSMPPSDIWKPDIVLLNALDEDPYMTNLGELDELWWVLALDEMGSLLTWYAYALMDIFECISFTLLVCRRRVILGGGGEEVNYRTSIASRELRCPVFPMISKKSFI